MSARQVQDHVRREGWRVAVPVAAGDHWQHEYWRDIVWRPPATILNSQRIFWWKSQFGVDYKESFLVIIWIWIVPRQIILKIWLCQSCYCTFLWEYLLDDLLFKWIHICPFDVYFNKNWKVSSLSSGEDQCVSTRALCMHPWTSCILFIKSSEALNRIWYLIGVHYRISTKKRKRNTES